MWPESKGPETTMHVFGIRDPDLLILCIGLQLSWGSMKNKGYLSTPETAIGIGKIKRKFA